MSGRNKRKRDNVKNDEPVSKRTRLATGAPMHKVIPVQYPQQWLKPRGKKCKNNIATMKGPSNVFDKNSYNQNILVNKSLPSTSKAVSGYGRRSHSRCSSKHSRKPNVKASGSRRVAASRGRSRSRRKARKMYRPRNSARPRAHQRRRKIVRIPKQKKGRGPRKVRRLKRRRYDNHRRPAFKQSLPQGHENNALFDKNRHKICKKREDKVMEDPLNVRNICRNLVRHVQGRPADARDYKPDNVKAGYSKSGNAKAGQQDQEKTEKNKTTKKDVSRRRHANSGQATRKYRPRRNRKKKRKGDSLRRFIDKHAKKVVVFRRRRKGVKSGHWSAPKRRNYNKRSSRANEVQRRQRANRSAEVARRRRN